MPAGTLPTPRFGPHSPQDNVWGGCVATGSNFTVIPGSWVEPQVTCNSRNDVFAPWDDASAEAVIESPSQSYPSFSSLDFSGITVNGQVFETYSPQGLDSGGYQPSRLSNGAFSMTGGFAQAHSRHSQAKPQTPIRY
jgi:hypothetical protein